MWYLMTKGQECRGAALGGEPAHSSQPLFRRSRPWDQLSVTQPGISQGPPACADQKPVTSFVPYPANRVNHSVLKVTSQHMFLKTFHFQISYGGKDRGLLAVPRSRRNTSLRSFSISKTENRTATWCCRSYKPAPSSNRRVTLAAIATNHASDYGWHFRGTQLYSRCKMRRGAAPAAAHQSPISICFCWDWMNLSSQKNQNHPTLTLHSDSHNLTLQHPPPSDPINGIRFYQGSWT